jgi:hypothetical protein
VSPRAPRQHVAFDVVDPGFSGCVVEVALMFAAAALQLVNGPGEIRFMARLLDPRRSRVRDQCHGGEPRGPRRAQRHAGAQLVGGASGPHQQPHRNRDHATQRHGRPSRQRVGNGIGCRCPASSNPQAFF